MAVLKKPNFLIIVTATGMLLFGGLYTVKAVHDHNQQIHNEQNRAHSGVQTAVKNCEAIFDQAEKLMTIRKIDINRPFQPQLANHEHPGGFHISEYYTNYRKDFTLFYEMFRESNQMLVKHNLKPITATNKMKRGLTFFKINIDTGTNSGDQ